MPPIPIKLGGTGAATLAGAKTALGIASGGSGPASTDALTEGTSNLYFTTARARAAISVSGQLTYSAGTGIITAPTLSPVATSGSASDLTSGMLPAARLPSPTATTLGGVVAKTAPTGQVQTGIDALGSPTFATPPAPTFTGDATNGAGTSTLTLAGVTTAGTVGSAGISVGVQVDAKGRVLNLTAYDSAALMDSKDNVAANGAATTATNYTKANALGSVRLSGGSDITCNPDAGVQSAPSGCVLKGLGSFTGGVIVIRYNQLQYVTINGAVGNATG